MTTRTALTAGEKERIYREKSAGRTLAAIAADLRCSLACVRKWWRRARDQGPAAWTRPRAGRGPTGAASRCDPDVVAYALALKQAHPGWGPDHVRSVLQQHPTLGQRRLPSRSRLAALFRERCPTLLASHRPRPPERPRPPRATAVHECWQLDSQEGIRLGDGQVATICSVRDEYGAAILGSEAFQVTTAAHWRKLTVAEVRGVLRAAFTAWQTLPQCVQTDNELCLAGAPTDPFPSLLTRWLQGLGVTDRFIRPGRPTDQAQIERSYRTLGSWINDPESLADLPHLQAALAREQEQHNRWLPSRASDCGGRPPLVAHPELLRPWRPYRPEAELALFDLQRVYAYLATIPLERKVNSVGRISLGRRMYSVGRRYAGTVVSVGMAAASREWVVYDAGGTEVARRRAQGLDLPTLTGLEEPPAELATPIQLALPLAA